ncbi:MAG: right-handed parallel beta-helix repeat-containing protein [Pirellulales bacterium]
MPICCAQEPSAAAFSSIQAAVDANPGRLVFVPAGDHVIEEKIRLRGRGCGLYGPGRIIQKKNDQPIIEIENAADAEIRGLTLTRPADADETGNEGVLAIKCDHLRIEDVKVVNNRTRSGAIVLRDCRDARVSHCLIRNYMRVSIDDRTANTDYGYAFQCTDGSGINVGRCVGTLIEANTILESDLLPTPELQKKHRLGEWVKKNEVKGKLVAQSVWDHGFSDNWQQGSAIVVTSPTESDRTRIVNNQIENAAQGIDLHCDHAIVSGNIISNSFMGMKAMHGSRNVLIIGNQFIGNTLWSIGLMPGAASAEGNSDGGSIIANNLISDFGKGHAAWIWGRERAPFKFDRGQHAEDPPLRDVLIQGNLIHVGDQPDYAYAVVIEHGDNAPRGLRFSGNLFPAGSQGVCNQKIEP